MGTKKASQQNDCGQPRVCVGVSVCLGMEEGLREKLVLKFLLSNSPPREHNEINVIDDVVDSLGRGTIDYVRLLEGERV